MEGSIEQMYPRSKGDYERYVDLIFSTMNKQTFEKDKKTAGANSVVVLGAVLDQCLSEATPEEVKELAKVVDEIINKKIELQNKELGKVKSKLKGNKLYEDGGGDFSHLDEEKNEKVDEEEKARMAKEQAEREAKDANAQLELKRKEAERAELQSKLKREERKVDTSAFAAMGFQAMGKKDDDFMGFGGKKKGKKK